MVLRHPTLEYAQDSTLGRGPEQRDAALRVSREATERAAEPVCGCCDGTGWVGEFHVREFSERIVCPECLGSGRYVEPEDSAVRVFGGDNRVR